MTTPSNFQDDSQITPQQNAILRHKEQGGTREGAIASLESLGFAKNFMHRQALEDIDAVYGESTPVSNNDSQIAPQQGYVNPTVPNQNGYGNRILPNQQVPDIFPNHPHGQLAQSREQKLEQATINKQKTLDNVSALKKASIEQTSDKVAASLDPESQKQYDLDNLDLVNYRLKYGIGADVIVEYTKNSMAKNSVIRAKREKQALADSHDGVDQVVDTSLGLLATGVSILGNTPAAAMNIVADPVDSVIAMADGTVNLGATFIGMEEEYKSTKEEIKSNVNQFLEENGIVTKPLPEELELGDAPNLSENFMETIYNLGEGFIERDKELLQDGAGMIFQGTKAVSDWIRSGQSDAYKAKNEIRAEENEQFKTKIKDALGEDAEWYEHALANTQVGFNAFGNLMKDPSAAAIVAVESVPYMMAAGTMSKAMSGAKFNRAFESETSKITNAVNKENLSHFTTQELLKVKLGEMAGDLIKKKDADQDTITAISAGVLEGSGAANEAYNVIVSTDFDVLEKTSAKYQNLVLEMSPYEARKQLAREASLSAGLSVFAIATGTVKILGNAEVINKAVGITKSKTKGVMPKAVELTMDIGKEGIEETFQSFIGGAATGIVEKENINPDKDIFGDAAIQAGEGGLAGALSSGAISTVRLTGEGLRKSGEIAKATNQKAADVSAKVQDIAKSGLSEADKSVTSTDTEIDVVAEGISERNQVETTKPDEQVDNLAEGWDIIEKYEAELEKVKDSFRANPNKQDSETIKAGQEKLDRAYEAFEKATIRNANAEELHKDILALKEGDKGAESRVLNNMATNPQSVPEEAARALLDTGSLNEQQTAQVQAHLQYIEDSKSMDEVAKDVKDGSEGYIGAAQYLSRISAALKANRPEQATKSLQMLAEFAGRQATKSREYTEALALTQTPDRTPVQQARLLELQNKYARTVKTKTGYEKVPAYFDHRGSERLVEQIGLEANMLQSAVATASLNIKAVTEGSNKAPESTSTETDTTSPEPATSTVETPTETVTNTKEDIKLAYEEKGFKATKYNSGSVRYRKDTGDFIETFLVNREGKKGNTTFVAKFEYKGHDIKATFAEDGSVISLIAKLGQNDIDEMPYPADLSMSQGVKGVKDALDMNARFMEIESTESPTQTQEEQVKLPYSGKSPKSLSDTQLLEVIHFDPDVDNITNSELDALVIEQEKYIEEAETRGIMESPTNTLNIKDLAGQYFRLKNSLASFTDRLNMLLDRSPSSPSIPSLQNELNIAQENISDFEELHKNDLKEIEIELNKIQSKKSKKYENNNNNSLLNNTESATNSLNKKIIKDIANMSKEELSKGIFRRKAMLDTELSDNLRGNISYELDLMQEELNKLNLKENQETQEETGEGTQAESQSTETTSVVGESVQDEDIASRLAKLEARLDEINAEVGNNEISGKLAKEAEIISDEIATLTDLYGKSEIKDTYTPESGKDLLKRTIEVGEYEGTGREIIAKAILRALDSDYVVHIVPANSPQLFLPTSGFHPGTYIPDSKKIFIADNTTPEQFNEILLHELIHAVMVPAYKITSNKTAKEKQFINEINTLYKFMVKKAKEDGVDKDPDIAYGLSDVDEFLAAGLSNPTFMKWMSDTEIAGKTILSRFTKAIADLLGINKKYYSALENILDISDLVLDDAPIQENQTKEPVAKSETVQEETPKKTQVQSKLLNVINDARNSGTDLGKSLIPSFMKFFNKKLIPEKTESALKMYNQAIIMEEMDILPILQDLTNTYISAMKKISLEIAVLSLSKNSNAKSKVIVLQKLLKKLNKLKIEGYDIFSPERVQSLIDFEEYYKNADPVLRKDILRSIRLDGEFNPSKTTAIGFITDKLPKGNKLLQEVITEMDSIFENAQTKEPEVTSDTVQEQAEPLAVESGTPNIQDYIGTKEDTPETPESNGTPESRLKAFKKENPVKRFVRLISEDAAKTNPLIAVSNFMDKFSSNILGYIEKYSPESKYRTNQVKLANNLLDHHKDFKKALDDIFIPFKPFKNTPKPYGYRDMTQYFTKDGKLDPAVVDAMSVVTYNWLATQAGGTLYNNDKDIRKMIGLSVSAPLTDGQIEHLRSGTLESNLASTLGADIMKSLSLTTIGSAPSNAKGQLENAFATLALTALKKQGLIYYTPVPTHLNLSYSDQKEFDNLRKIAGGTDNIGQVLDMIRGESNQFRLKKLKQYAKILGTERNKVEIQSVMDDEKGYLEPHPILQKIMDSVKDTDQMLSKMFQADSYDKGPSKEPNKKAVSTVRGTNQKVSKADQKIIVKHQAVKHYLKRSQVERFLELPVELQRELLGYIPDVKSKQVNLQDGYEGINRSINASIKHMNDYLAENNNDEPFYYSHVVTKNGRLLLDSNTFQPQADKLHRHMMKIEGQESTIDLRSEDDTQLNAFLLAVGQGMGVKVDKQNEAKSIAEVRAMIDKPWFVAAIEALNSPLDSRDNAAILFAVKKGGEKAWSFDALVAYSEYVNAALNGSDLFTHDLMMEVDGVTNGPGIATLQMGIGSNEDKKERLKKISINTDGDTEEFGDYIDEPANLDNYETITVDLNDKVSKLTGSRAKFANFGTYFLGKLVEIKDGVEDLNRNITKNPLMVTIYGSSAKAIKAAMGKATVTKIYEALEKNANNPQELKNIKDMLKNTFNIELKDKKGKPVNPLEFTFTPSQVQTIENNIGETLGQSMVESITENYGQFTYITKVFNKALEVVAENFQEMYEHEVKTRTEKMVEEGILAANAKGEPFEALSSDTLNEIFTSLLEAQPIVQSVESSQNGNKTEEGLYVGKKGKAEGVGPAYLTSIVTKNQDKDSDKATNTNNTRGQVTIYVPGFSSPMVLAIQNIDATTMLRHLRDKISTNIYDAIITGVDNIFGNTQNLNKNFFETIRDHSIPNEFIKAYQRAELATMEYDKKNGTNFRKNFNAKVQLSYENDAPKIDIKSELKTVATAAEEGRLDTIDRITSSGQYYKEGASHVVENAETRPMGSNPSFEAKEGEYASVAQQQVDKMNVLDVFDEVGKLGNKKEDAEHSNFLREGINVLKHKLTDPLKFHLADILSNKDAKGNDTMANIEGKDIWLYTQMFGGQKGSTAILNSGLRMSTQEALAHELWHAVSRQGVEGNSKAKKELERRWKQAKQTVKVTDLMDDPTLPETSAEYMEAKETWDYIFTERDDLVEIEVDPISGQKIEKNYSNHLHEFAAYSMTNQKFIAALKTVPVNTKVDTETEVTTDSEGNTVTNYLSNLYDKLVEFLGDIVDMLSTHLTNTNNVPTDFAVRELVKQLANIEAQNKNLILSTVDSIKGAQGKLGTLVSPVVSGITKGLRAVATAPFIRDSKSAIIKLPSNIVKLADNSEHAKYVFTKINQTKRNLASQKEGFAEQLWTEAQGLLDKLKDFHSLSRLKTKIIDGAVVETEAQVLRILEKAFGKPLTEEQSHAITKAFLKTDLSTMNLTTTQLIELLDDPARIDSLINTLESSFKGDVNENHYILQTKALGYYMATGKVTSAKMNFNAKQIARLFGTNRTNVNAAKVERSIDQLATLYALKHTNTKSKQDLSDVLKSNPEGMEYLQAFHNEQKKIDAKEVFAGSEVNIAKGHIRDLTDPTVQVVALPESEGDIYEARGWTKSANPLPKDPANTNAPAFYLYVDRHGGQTDTISGVVSLNSKQAQGTDTIALRAKFDSNDPVYGGIQDAKAIHAQKDVIFKNSISGAKTFDPTVAKQHMAPLYNLSGQVTGYRYLMTDATKEKTLGRNNDAFRVLAKGAASTVNKVNSAELNSRAIKALKEHFDAEPNSNYVQVGPNSNDPEVLEIYRLLPKEAKDDIKKYWGGNTMFVDKKILTMMFGYRKYSVADEIAKERAEQSFAIRGLEYVNGVIGGAFGYSSEQVARSTGQYWGEFVRFSKDFIVIKTGMVTIGNTISNGIHLLTEGVGLINALKLQKEAIVELTKYRKDKAALFEAEKALELGIGNQKGLPAKIAGLKASITANPVTDVINDGLLQTIVEDVSLVDDEFSKAAKIDNALDKAVYRHIPGWTKAIGRELFQTKDSILYKKMSQSAQLSDFTARYALYKHTINHPKPSKRLNRQDAANNAISTFINYDLPTHKLIQYGNDMGFLWFTKYYVRVQKILLKTLINNTARVLGLLSFEWMFGDVFPDIYDTTLAPENIYNRVGLAKNPVDVFLEDSLISKVL